MSIRSQYEKHGALEFYRAFGSVYRNPHEPAIADAIGLATRRWPLDLANVLDLACGSGEVTLALRVSGGARVVGVDPYTGAAYYERTGQVAQPLTFEEIAAGALDEQQYTTIVCSYALHLVEESRLPLLMWQLAGLSPSLLVLSPHKRPEIHTHWKLHGEFIHERVHTRLYRSVRP